MSHVHSRAPLKFYPSQSRFRLDSPNRSSAFASFVPNIGMLPHPHFGCILKEDHHLTCFNHQQALLKWALPRMFKRKIKNPTAPFKRAPNLCHTVPTVRPKHIWETSQSLRASLETQLAEMLFHRLGKPAVSKRLPVGSIVQIRDYGDIV